MPIVITRPENTTVLVKTDQEINFETDLFEQVSQSEIKIQISNKLKIAPIKIFKHLHKFVGEKIEKGELLAVKKNVFSDLKYLSEYEGTIKEINHETGEVILTTNNKASKVKSFFSGTVTSIKDYELTIILPSEKLYFDLKITSKDFGNETLYLKKIDNHLLTEEAVNNKVIIAENIDTYTLIKLEALGSTGFITLKELNCDTKLPHAQFKNIDDLNKIFDYNCKYCLIGLKQNRIYLYN